MIRVSAVSYTNTKPFVYGLTHADIMHEIDLSLDPPAICASKLINHEVDISLIPVAILLDNPNYEIISDYCIGAKACVDSVFIFSDKPIHQIKTIRLDSESRTSNALAKVLLKNYWKSSPEFTTSTDADAYVEIGDRTFGKKNQYRYVYDLAEAWNKFTGLPFVFAVWATNTCLSTHFTQQFNIALKHGLDMRLQIISELAPRTDFDLNNYLMNQLDFNFDIKKKRALNDFLDLVQQL